jgi:hypothetical protein
MRFVPFAAVAAIAVGTIAIAQAPQAAPQDRAARWQEHRADFEARFEAERKRRADDVALLIGLRPEQRPAFDAMMSAMAPPHRDWGADKQGGPDADAADEGTEARIARMSARIDARSAEEKTKLDALKRFYDGLSPDQRLRFDALDRLRHDHDRMAMRGGRGDHGRGGHDGPGGSPATHGE